jgi:hypothetical protein
MTGWFGAVVMLMTFVAGVAVGSTWMFLYLAKKYPVDDAPTLGEQ